MTDVQTAHTQRTTHGYSWSSAEGAGRDRTPLRATGLLAVSSVAGDVEAAQDEFEPDLELRVVIVVGPS